MLKAVIFDHDGVLVDSEKLHMEVWRQFVNEHEIEISDAELRRKVQGRSAIEGVESIFKGKPGELYYQDLAEKREWMFLERYATHVTPVEGVVDFAKCLAADEIKLAVASSATHKRLNISLETLGLDTVVDVIVGVDDVKKSKPEPDIFLKAAEQLMTGPDECIVFEDSILGIQAAKRAGMKVVGVTTSLSDHELREVGVDMVIENFVNFELDRLRPLLS